MSNESYEPERLEPPADAQADPILTEAIGEEEVSAVAHELWIARGCPIGSPEEDWFRAQDEIRMRKASAATAG